MDLSIVIVNWNTKDLLRDCLKSVQQNTGALQLEILVVDNASSDQSAEMVKQEFPSVVLFENSQNLGFAAGNNVALEQVQGRHVLLLNTDTLVHGSVLQDAVVWMDAHPNVGIVGPKVLNTDGSIQTSCSRFPTIANLCMQSFGLTKIPQLDRYRMTGWGRTATRHVDVISGAALFARRSAIEEVGLLDDSFFFFGEETDWCLRFKKKGWDIVYLPMPAITHFGGVSAEKLHHKRDVLLTQGTTRLHYKHGGLGAAVVCFGLLAFHNLSRAVLWSVLTPTGMRKARQRGQHFRNVCAELHKAWPTGSEWKVSK